MLIVRDFEISDERSGDREEVALLLVRKLVRLLLVLPLQLDVGVFVNLLEFVDEAVDREVVLCPDVRQRVFQEQRIKGRARHGGIRDVHLHGKRTAAETEGYEECQEGFPVHRASVRYDRNHAAAPSVVRKEPSPPRAMAIARKSRSASFLATGAVASSGSALTIPSSCAAVACARAVNVASAAAAARRALMRSRFTRAVIASATSWFSANWPMVSVTLFAFVLKTIRNTPSWGDSGVTFVVVPGSVWSFTKIGLTSPEVVAAPGAISLKKRSTARSS